MHRGCVNNFPISAKIARERSAWSPIDSNSDGPLRLWWTTDFGSVNAAESAVAAEQPIDTIKKNERTDIAVSPQIRMVSATGANCSAEPLFYFPLDVIRRAQKLDRARDACKGSNTEELSTRTATVFQILNHGRLPRLASVVRGSAPLASYPIPRRVSGH
jgi:hypothetical protein